MKQQSNPSIYQLLEYARLAPSVHNTQPWRFSIEASTVLVFANSQRALKAGDPTGRELWISLGCCIETILHSAKGLGLNPIIQSLQTESLKEPIAKISIKPSLNQDPELLKLVTDRHSYRGAMKKTSIPKTLLEECRNSIKDLSGISVHLIADTDSIHKIASLTSKGMSLALSSPDFRKELADLVNYNWSKEKVGMPGYVLNRGAVGSIWEKISIKFGWDIKRKAHADQQKVAEASGLLFIASKGDVPRFWLASGQAYIRVVFEVMKAGLDHSTLAAPVEAASFHEDIEKMLRTEDRIQAMIRVGTAKLKDNRTTPRLDVDSLT